MNGVRVVNLTNFFNRELFMYSLGDIRFKKPIALKKVAYITGFLICWSIPIYLTFGVIFNPFYFGVWLGLPIAAGHIASKPVFGGKGLLDFTKTLITFLGEPKGWTDFNPSSNLEDDVFFVEQEVWISRRRELTQLSTQQGRSVA